MIKREISILDLEPEELAQEFCDMHNDEQALFFEHIGKIVKEQWKSNFSFQMDTIIDEVNKMSYDNAKTILKCIKDYVEGIE